MFASLCQPVALLSPDALSRHPKQTTYPIELIEGPIDTVQKFGYTGEKEKPLKIRRNNVRFCNAAVQKELTTIYDGEP